MIKKSIKKILRTLKLNFLINDIYNLKENIFNRKNKRNLKNFILFNRKLIIEKELIFDIGANVGEYTETYLKIGAKKIIAIEPQKNVFKKLKNKFKNNSKVIPLQVGIGSKKGELEMFISDEADKISTFSKNQVENSRLKENLEWNRKELVKIITIEDLINKYGIPNFVKIDVEGFELDIFKGLKTKIPKFQFEFLKKENFQDLKKIFSLLNKIGNYKYNMISNFKSNTYLFNKFIDSDFFLDFVEKINDEKLIGNSLLGDIIVKLKE